ERDYLKTMYGDSLDLDDIRIHRGDTSNDAGIAPHTVGNDIYIPDDGKYWNADGSLSEEGKLLLLHEPFQAYQSQKCGNDYIHDALLAQVGGMVEGGSRNKGYDFTDALKSGKPFSEWNPEQQAEFMETMARARGSKFDANNNGRIDANELARAFYD